MGDHNHKTYCESTSTDHKYHHQKGRIQIYNDPRVDAFTYCIVVFHHYLRKVLKGSEILTVYLEFE